MIYKVIILDNALKQIDIITNYISIEFHNPNAAKKLIDNLQIKINGLKDFPRIYPIVKDRKYQEIKIRRFPFGSFLAYYWIDENDKAVYIAAITYMKRNQEDELSNIK